MQLCLPNHFCLPVIYRLWAAGAPVPSKPACPCSPAARRGAADPLRPINFAQVYVRHWAASQPEPREPASQAGCTRHNSNRGIYIGKCFIVKRRLSAAIVAVSQAGYHNSGGRLEVIQIFTAESTVPDPLVSTDTGYLSNHLRRWAMSIAPRNSSMTTCFCWL